jgi:DNA modification methylase
MGTKTSAFGASKREGHDSSGYYKRGLVAIEETKDKTVAETSVSNDIFLHSAEDMHELPDASVALMVTSPPYHVGKDYDSDATFEEYLEVLQRVWAETYRVLEPGGRAVINVANLGRRPYIPLSHIVTRQMLDLGFYMRGEIIWQKAKGASGSCAWGSWRSATNPVVRDIHEYCLVFSKGRFDRVRRGESTITAEEFMAGTLSIWEVPAESATRAGHPAPFPVALPRRFVELYTFENDLVLDPFMGSGSTALAAVETDRRYVGYEISEEYLARALERVAEASL